MTPNGFDTIDYSPPSPTSPYENYIKWYERHVQLRTYYQHQIATFTQQVSGAGFTQLTADEAATIDANLQTWNTRLNVLEDAMERAQINAINFHTESVWGDRSSSLRADIDNTRFNFLQDVSKQMGISGSGGGGGGFAPTPPMVLQDNRTGTLFFLDPFSGAEISRTTIPELAQRDLQVEIDRNGDLIAFDPTDDRFRPVILQEDFQFAQIDPEREFRLQQQRVEAELAGIELQRRGQEIAAIGQDFANQITLGRMTYEEARVRLDAIDSALANRRAEREQLLQFGVTRASITARGTTMLPGGEQLAALLSQATGQFFPTQFAELGITNINPEGAAQDVLAASNFESPLPGLQQGLASSREAINAIIGAPLGTELTNQTATNMVTENI